MTSRTVITKEGGQGIVKITLNRPKALNALNIDLLNDLVDALRTNANARVIILEGAGDRSFCAGEDLKQTLAPKTGSAEELRLAFGKLQDLTRLTSSSSAIIIAAVHGFAIGGGAEIALAADFVIGGPAARFRFPEVPIGHAATGGITLRLVQMVGLLRAKELLICGRFIDAEESLRIGLLSEIAEDPKERALELALQIAGLPATSASSSKSSLERAVFPNMEGVLQDEVNVASYCFAQSDAAKAFSDFAKRKSEINGSSSNGHSEEVHVNGIHEPTISKERSVSTAPAIKDLNAALSQAAKSFPSRPFIRFAGQDTTFEDFNSSVSKLAGGFRELGIAAGDRVLVMMRNSVEMAYTWFASNRLGATWVPINVELKSITLQHVVQAAEPKVAIVDAEFHGDILATNVFRSGAIYVKGQSETNALSELYHLGSPVETALVVKPSTTSAFLYTSGTTGRSKPCILSHQYFILQAQALIEGFGIRPDDVLYCPFPLFHADATALTTIPALLLGATAALSPRFSVSKFWTEIRDTKATVYDFMGATLALLYKQHPTDRDRDHHVRLAWGVPIPTWAEEYETRFGHPLYTLYGSVEASLPIMQHGARIQGSCGKARKGYHVRIADDDDEPVPQNTPGHLLLRSDVPNAFFQGYFNSSSTLDAFANLWLHTGDLAKVDSDGNVYFLGRVKDVIRRRGENINAVEIEEELLRHPDVVMAAAFAVPSALGQGTEDDVKVAVAVREGSTITEEELWGWTVKNMARFQVPSVVEFVGEIKKTPTGKVEKSELRVEGGKRFDGWER